MAAVEAEKAVGTRRNWTRDETLALLSSYSRRINEFQHSRKKKNAFKNVLEDLLSSGVLISETTVPMIINKIHSLLKAYKAAQDNARKTGACPCVAPFMEEMDEIFGNKPIISNNHSLSLSVGNPVSALEDDIENNNVEEIPVELPITSQVPDHTESLNRQAQAGTSGSTQNTTPQQRKRKEQMTRATYFAKKLKLKEEAEAGKHEQREKWMRIREEHIQKHHEEKMNYLRSLLEK